MLLEMPFYAFWILLFLGHKKLGLRGIAIAIGVWAALYLVIQVLGMPAVLFVSAQALLDAGLVLIVFGGDVKF